MPCATSTFGGPATSSEENKQFYLGIGLRHVPKDVAEAVQELKQESFAELFEEETKASQRCGGSRH